MSGDGVGGVSYEPAEANPASGDLYRIPIDAPIGRELFPVMAILLAQVLDSDDSRINQGLGR